MSENIEMYLLRIAMLQQIGQPVPIPKLAQELSVSPVSANEMCRKLMDQGLIKYEPYKGSTLTIEGRSLARQILRHRRLWEVFFVEKLNIELHEAETMACRFEHVTPSDLADQLAKFLGNPTFSPQNEPIPYDDKSLIERPVRPLATLAAGEWGQVVNVVAAGVTRDFLRNQGLSPGVIVAVLGVAMGGSLLLETAGQRLSLSQAIAADIEVTPVAKTKLFGVLSTSAELTQFEE